MLSSCHGSRVLLVNTAMGVFTYFLVVIGTKYMPFQSGYFILTSEYYGFEESYCISAVILLLYFAKL